MHISIEAGNIRLDSSNCKVTCDGQLLHLTAKEYTLLELLLRNSHRIFSQKALIDHLWSSEEIPTENTVRTHIKALRQKLKQAGADGLDFAAKVGEREMVLGKRKCSKPLTCLPFTFYQLAATGTFARGLVHRYLRRYQPISRVSSVGSLAPSP